jgi:hypothetical protein
LPPDDSNAAGIGLHERIVADIRRRHPRSLPGVLEAIEVDPERFRRLAGLFGGWLVGAYGESAIERMNDALVRFSMDVNFAQAEYEQTGHYVAKTFRECEADLYANAESMDEYLWGVYATSFMWAHHMDLAEVFEKRFLRMLNPDAHIVEVAPGHGGWGLWALEHFPNATLEAYDVSASSIGMANQLARAAGFSDRARYERRDVMLLDGAVTRPADACICSFLIEHLEQPHRLLEIMEKLLKPRGIAFLAGALTAAQVDHIFEFRRESELVSLAERSGFRVIEMRSAGPRRTLPGARFLPRSAAFVLQKRIHELW